MRCSPRILVVSAVSAPRLGRVLPAQQSTVLLLAAVPVSRTQRNRVNMCQLRDGVTGYAHRPGDIRQTHLLFCVERTEFLRRECMAREGCSAALVGVGRGGCGWRRGVLVEGLTYDAGAGLKLVGVLLVESACPGGLARGAPQCRSRPIAVVRCLDRQWRSPDANAQVHG